mmetsp:Transcript_58399/g.170791  ORF Transcript_58399/g.170791 Transcript_58399/m.170791 type:complete len:238 (+) Transcript_58399:283-996(+)
MASRSSAPPPCSHDERLPMRLRASSSSSTRFSVIGVMRLEDRKRCSWAASTACASSKRPSSPCPAAVCSVCATSTRCRCAATSTSGSSSGCGSPSGRLRSRISTAGVCTVAPAAKFQYFAEAFSSRVSSSSRTVPCSKMLSSTRTSRRSPASMSGIWTTARPPSAEWSKCVCTFFRATEQSSTTSTRCAVTLDKPPMAPANAALILSTSSTNVNGVFACSATSESNRESWSAPKPNA